MFYHYEVCAYTIIDDGNSDESVSVAKNPENDPLYWNPIYSSRYTKIRIDDIGGSDWYINKPTVNWEEYTLTNFTRGPVPAFQNNKYFEYWAFFGDQDYMKIWDDKVWACEHSRSEFCACIPPGSLSSEMNGVWRETLTKASRFEIKHRSVNWIQSQLFYPGELSVETDGVYRCKAWPRSESCGGYEPSQSGAATYIWEFTDILKSDTTQDTINASAAGI